jgi:hypothetical protein
VHPNVILVHLDEYLALIMAFDFFISSESRKFARRNQRLSPVGVSHPVFQSVDSVDFRKKVFISHHHPPLAIHHFSYFIFHFSISAAVLLQFHTFFIFHSIIFHSFFRPFEKKLYLCSG